MLDFRRPVAGSGAGRLGVHAHGPQGLPRRTSFLGLSPCVHSHSNAVHSFAQEGPSIWPQHFELPHARRSSPNSSAVPAAFENKEIEKTNSRRSARLLPRSAYADSSLQLADSTRAPNPGRMFCERKEEERSALAERKTWSSQ
jgi:hypothetical protein